MSTSTSTIEPRAQRTSFAMPRWKCMPRSTPSREREWLFCTHSSSTPSSSNTLRRKVSAKKPRSSPCTIGSTRTGPSSRVTRLRMALATLVEARLGAVGDQLGERQRRGRRRRRRVTDVQGARRLVYEEVVEQRAVAPQRLRADPGEVGLEVGGIQARDVRGG